WQKRDLSAKRYVYCWADGIHLEARLEEQVQCILVIKSSSRSRHDCELSRMPSVKPTSSFLPSGVAPMKASRADNGAADCGRQACPRESGGRARVLEGARRGVADNPRATLLGAQNRHNPEQAAEEPTHQGQARAAGDLDGRDQEGCRY